jgi:VWFA-related protein
MDRGVQSGGPDLLTRFCWLSLLAVSSFTSALAQRPLDLPPVQTESTPPVSSGPIRLNVVVTDKGGHPIPGLQQPDFALLDGKQPAAIRDFAAHDPAAAQNDPQTMVILIDDVNANFSVVSIVRTQIENFLHRNGGKLPVRTGILMLGDKGLEEVAQPSTDGNMLAGVLHQKDGELHDITRASGFYGAEEKTELSLRALHEVATSLGRIDGRKLVIWVGPGWPIFDNPNVMISSEQQRRFFSGIVDISGLLRTGQISVSSIDPIGPVDAAGNRNYLWEGFTKPVTKPSKADPGDLALQVFAVHSGGTVSFGSNDITGEIAKCAEDAAAWYSMTFDPQKADSPNTWHDLTLKVDKPGLKVRTVNGYYAQP